MRLSPVQHPAVVSHDTYIDAPDRSYFGTMEAAEEQSEESLNILPRPLHGKGR
jgi:hypothetical protein